MTDVRLKIAPPWITYVNQVSQLFKHDPDIEINYNNDIPEVILTINNPDKATAISKLLPCEAWFGGVKLLVTINAKFSNRTFKTPAELFNVAFERNPVFAFTHSVQNIFSNSLTYVVFKNKVVQFFNDNLNDIYGNISTLYEDLASDVFSEADVRGVCYCTDIEEKVGMPLGEWP